MSGYEEAMRQEYEDNMNVFNTEVRPYLSDLQLQHLEEYMGETANTGFQVLDEPCTEYPEDDFVDDFPLQIYVVQTMDGGHTGDQFAGSVSVALNNGKFFNYAYSI